MRVAVSFSLALRGSLIFSVEQQLKQQRSSLSCSFVLLPYLPSSRRTLVVSRSRPPTMASTEPATVAEDVTAKYGFERDEMFKSSLANTVDPYDRHVFLCFKSYEQWPSRVEDSDTDLLPKLLSAALKARKDDIKVKTRLTICGGCDGTDWSDGDVLIFPEMIKIKNLKESEVDAFVDDVLVNGRPWTAGVQDALTGVYVFVCAHANRDKRCGVCGPILIEKFKVEIELRGLSDQVSVSACSHIGGHKYAGNVIIFGTNSEGKIIGDWYGYVTPDDVPNLIDLHIGKGEIIEKLWRGQMGLYEESGEKEEKKAPTEKETKEKPQEPESVASKESNTGCCQGPSAVSCCRDGGSTMNSEAVDAPKHAKKNSACAAWMGKWEQSDILMGAAVVGAVATVAVAYSFYRRSG